MAYKVFITRQFDRDIEETLDYISETLASPAAAGRLLKTVEETVARIVENPFLYPVYHNRKIADKGYRYTVINKKYDLFYIVCEEDKTVGIHRLIYAGRDIGNAM